VRAAAADVKLAFMTRAEALIHGDLHTGSVMVREDGSTRAFDGEFCFYGPVGFDIGLLWANFIVALAGDHARGRDEHARWVATLPAAAWAGFEDEIRAQWPSRVDPRGFPDAFLDGWLRAVRRDAVGFAAAEAARRVVGLAHVADIEALEPGARAAASRGVLATVERLLLERDEIEGPGAVAALAAQEIARAA
jgi:5-methylthioribose kinase